MTQHIKVYTYPFQLVKGDVIVDGPESGDNLKLKPQDNTMFIWVDLFPDSRFAHPTKYIFISQEGVDLKDGHWWPVLNGQRILLGQNPIAVSSPFVIATGEPSGKRVQTVSEVEFKFLLTHPGKLLISAVGTTTTAGWRDVRLEPLIYVAAPPDGIWGFTFVGDPPVEEQPRETTTVCASYLVHNFSGWKGVRVIAETNSIEKLLSS